MFNHKYLKNHKHKSNEIYMVYYLAYGEEDSNTVQSLQPVQTITDQWPQLDIGNLYSKEVYVTHHSKELEKLSRLTCHRIELGSVQGEPKKWSRLYFSITNYRINLKKQKKTHLKEHLLLHNIHHFYSKRAPFAWTQHCKWECHALIVAEM